MENEPEKAYATQKGESAEDSTEDIAAIAGTHDVRLLYRGIVIGTG